MRTKGATPSITRDNRARSPRAFGRCQQLGRSIQPLLELSLTWLACETKRQRTTLGLYKAISPHPDYRSDTQPRLKCHKLMSSMPNSDVLIPAADLTAFSASLLDAVGVSAAKSKLVAESLVAANLRGVDSHGVQLLPYYIEQLEWGDMDARADGRVISETGACLLYDGQNGIGQPIAETCCAHAVRIARANGVGVVVARESNHFGAAAFWAQKMA